MERKYAKFFIGLVHELIHDNGQREKLFDALRVYQTDQDLSKLLSGMREVLDEPSKLDLYDCLRPLILLQHQVAYSEYLPSAPGVKARIIRLHRRQGEGLGFAVRGGVEHRVGVFVTDVKSGTQAHKKGLMIGDEILAVNGFSIAEAIHQDVLNLIKARDDIVLKVTNLGMVPSKEDAKAEIKWKYVNSKQDNDENVQKQRDLKIFIDSSGHHSLGCGIVSGPPQSPGIFVEKVRPGSMAEIVHLEPGDLLVEVNGTSFQRISHKEAVLALVSSRQLNITIRKGVGLKWMEQVPHLKSAAEREPQKDDSLQTSVPHQNNPLESDAVTLVDNSRQDVPLQASTKIYQSEFLESAGRASSQQSEDNSSVTTKAEVYPDKSLLASQTTSSRGSSESVKGFDGFVLKKSPANSQQRIDPTPLPSSSSSPMSGAAAVMEQRRLQRTLMPSLLGPGSGDDYSFQECVSNKVYDMFSLLELNGRVLHCLIFNRKLDLGIHVEGGSGTHLDGKIVVAKLKDNGIALKSGHIDVGDQLMALNGQRLIDVTAEKAEDMLKNATSTNSLENVELIFCASAVVNEEECVTYF